MSDSTPARRVIRRRSRKGPLGVFFTQCLPWILISAVIGLAIYNPIYGLVNLFQDVINGSFGTVADFEGNELPFYKQPVLIGLLLVCLILAVYIWMKFEIARNERTFIFLWILGIILFNALILFVWEIFGPSPFSARWVEWQIAPTISSALAFGSTFPKVRKAFSGTFTGGGGSFDEITETVDDSL